MDENPNLMMILTKIVEQKCVNIRYCIYEAYYAVFHKFVSLLKFYSETLSNLNKWPVKRCHTCDDYNVSKVLMFNHV